MGSCARGSSCMILANCLALSVCPVCMMICGWVACLSEFSSGVLTVICCFWDAYSYLLSWRILGLFGSLWLVVIMQWRYIQLCCPF